MTYVSSASRVHSKEIFLVGCHASGAGAGGTAGVALDPQAVASNTIKKRPIRINRFFIAHLLLPSSHLAFRCATL
ncbi:hypothetical protein ACFLX4_03065 [Chloroflexota bacterium]